MTSSEDSLTYFHRQLTDTCIIHSMDRHDHNVHFMDVVWRIEQECVWYWKWNVNAVMVPSYSHPPYYSCARPSNVTVCDHCLHEFLKFTNSRGLRYHSGNPHCRGLNEVIDNELLGLIILELITGSVMQCQLQSYNDWNAGSRVASHGFSCIGTPSHWN